MSSSNEVEIKFEIGDLNDISERLKRSGFGVKTPRTHEMNTLYDRLGQPLRRKGELLRLRKYGSEWLLTHKSKGSSGRHKTRVETQTKVADGEKMEAMLTALGYRPTFRYEKYRTEWSDGKGYVLVDETPIGNFGEIEGPPEWIDETAQALGVDTDQYITSNYATLFFDWKKRAHSRAREMSFQEISKTDLRP